MTKTRSELWRRDREIMVSQALSGADIVQAVNNRLEGLREAMHEAMELPPPRPYATTSMQNLKLLCDDLESLTIGLVLRAKGLTNEADAELADEIGGEIEECSCGGAAYTRRH